MEQLLWNLLKASVIGSGLIMILLVFRSFFRSKIQAKTFCIAWAVIAVFLLNPFDFSLSNAPISVEMPQSYSSSIDESETATDPAEKTLLSFRSGSEEEREKTMPVQPETIQNEKTEHHKVQNLTPTKAISLVTIVSGIYLIGIAVFLSLYGIRFLRFRSWISRWQKDCEDIRVTQILKQMSSAMQIRLPRPILCEALPTPLLLGIRNPVLLLPQENYTDAELRFIVCHELMHEKRRDIAFQLFLLFVNAIHWFNPFVYRMRKEANEDIELACDSDVTSKMKDSERMAYSETLLHAISRKTRCVPMTTCFGTTKERIKRRMENVLGKKKRRGRFIIVAVVVCILVFGLCVSCTQSDSSDQFGGSNIPKEADTHNNSDTHNEADALTDKSDDAGAAVDANAAGIENVSAVESDSQRIVEQRIAEFTGFLGLSGYITCETDPQDFNIWRYYTKDDQLIAESYGYVNDDYGIDLDHDGILELVCNCVSGGDGHETVLIYRMKNNCVECGILGLNNMELADYHNWGVNSTACRYSPRSNQFVLTYTSETDHSKSNEKICTYEDFAFAPWKESTYAESQPVGPIGNTPSEVRNSIRAITDTYLEYAGAMWYVSEGYFYRYSDAENKSQQLCKLPLTDDRTPVSCRLEVLDNRIGLSYHIGRATMGSDQMYLFDEEGMIVCMINGFGKLAVKGNIIVKTNGYQPPEPGNLLISRDSGNTWEPLGDPQYLYGMRLLENGSSYAFTDTDVTFTIEDGYLNTDAIDMSFRSDAAKKPEMITVSLEL